MSHHHQPPGGFTAEWEAAFKQEETLVGEVRKSKLECFMFKNRTFAIFSLFQLSKEQEGRRSSLTNQSFLPSNLFALGQLGHLGQMQAQGGGGGGAGGVQQLGKAPAEEKSEWFQLFADLDPLANPDTVGRKDGWDGGC